MRLIVYWGPDERANFQIPEEVKWEDGTPATLDDYARHQLDTQCTDRNNRGSVTVIFPDVVATTHYDTAIGHWICQDPKLTVPPIVLDETDPNASDETLRSELIMYPVSYKSTFDRSHLTQTTAQRI